MGLTFTLQHVATLGVSHEHLLFPEGAVCQAKRQNAFLRAQVETVVFIQGDSLVVSQLTAKSSSGTAAAGQVLEALDRCCEASIA